MCIGDCVSLAEVIFLMFPPNLWFSVVGSVWFSCCLTNWIWISSLLSAVFLCAWPSFYVVQVDLSSNLLTELPVTFGDLLNLKVPGLFMFSLCYSLFSQFCDTNILEVNSDFRVSCPCYFAQALHLSNNGLKSLPSTIFKMCLQLSTLDLHNTEITMDVLRQVSSPFPILSCPVPAIVVWWHNKTTYWQLEGWQDFDDRRRSKHQKQLDFRVVGSAEFDEGADKLWCIEWLSFSE